MLLTVGAASLAAQPRANRPPPQFLQKGQPDQAEGARVLTRFRQAGIAGNYWLEIVLEILPRQGAARKIKGQLLGTRNELGPVSRLTLETAPDGNDAAASPTRWLLQSGLQPAVWTCAGSGAPARPVKPGDWLQPVAGTDLTPFDLQMPFIYWEDFVFEGAAKVRGRLAHSFVLYPPSTLAAQRPGLHGVRVLLDTEFDALLRAELLGPGGKTEKTITILELKRTGEKWLPRAIDVRNELTRDKTRFEVTAAALDLTLPAETFAPAALSLPPPAIPAAAVVRFN
jgi:hypothetical protein